MIKKNDVVQFNENHKWCGCIGIATEVKPSKILVAIPMPCEGITYTYCLPEHVERIGKAVFVKEEEK